MKKQKYTRPESEIVLFDLTLLGTVNYFGNAVSGGDLNPTNSGSFSEDDEEISIPSQKSLWDN